jgi:hypothetical protein
VYFIKPKRGIKMAKKKTVESSEFMYLPLGSIIVEEQIRSKIDTESESFKALMSSIKDKGVLEPVLVTPKGYLNLSRQDIRIRGTVWME